jgi:hypothetical protein
MTPRVMTLVVMIAMFLVVAVNASTPKPGSLDDHKAPSKSQHRSGSRSKSASAPKLPPLEEKDIKCKVCDRAVAHVWHQGARLRQHCKIHATDPRCKVTNLHKHGIEEMVRDMCDELPHTHQALHDSEFELIAHDSPEHEDDVIEAISRACKRWVHDTNTIEYLTRMIFANLDAGKSAKQILKRLQERFCDQACRPEPEPENADL